MLTRTLLFIKHRVPLLWTLVDWLNARLYRLLHKRKMTTRAESALVEFGLEGIEFRSLGHSDLEALEELLKYQSEERLRYFQPHGFDRASLDRMLRNPSFLMFGAFSGRRLIGYFFLRCFWNRRCFVGRLIDRTFEGRGIGRVMNQIMYQTAWRSGFRCMTTISRHNRAIIRSHSNNPSARLIGELSNGYLLIEFLPEGTFNARDRLSL